MRLRLALLFAAVSLSGCLDSSGGELVTVFATHHASPDGDAFPFRGDDLQPRIFPVGDGWEVTLAESYVTIASTTLVSCGGQEHSLQMFWGPCPEDLRRADLEVLTVSGLKVPPGDYCELQVEYAPYKTPVVDDETDTRHVVPTLEDVEGDSIFIRGIARRGEDESVPFQLENGENFVVDLDLSNLEGEGNPMTISEGQAFPKELTITKTYDRFFDEVDWENFDEDLLENSVDEVLADQTRVVGGVTISPDVYDD